MKVIRSRKGFTMIELLAVIIILGIVTAISVVTIQGVLRRAKANYYKSQEESISASARNYAEKNPQYLPKLSGQKTTVTLKTLIDSKYISSVVDYSKKSCHIDNSYVQVLKVDNEFIYSPYLECDDYKTNIKELTGEFENFDIVFTGGVNDAKAKITLQEHEYGIASYYYKVYDANSKKILFTSEIYAGKNNKTIINRDISLTNFTPAKLKVAITATNAVGSEHSFSKTYDYVDDGSKIRCGTNTGVEEWTTSSDRTISVQCLDGTDTIGCAKDSFTKKFTTSMKYGTITIKDRNNISRECSVPVFIDSVIPSVTADTIVAGKNNLSIHLSDNIDVTHYAITTSSSTPTSWTSVPGEDVTSYDKTFTKNNGTYYIHVKDAAGNTTFISKDVLKIGNPTVSLTSNGSAFDGGWTNKSVTANLSVSSDEKITSWQYSTDGSTWTTISTPTLGHGLLGGGLSSTDDDQKNRKVSYSTNKSYTYSYRAVSESGAVSAAVQAPTFGIDTVPPSCDIIVADTNYFSSYYSDRFYHGPIYATLTHSDSLSGEKYYDILFTPDSIFYDTNIDDRAEHIIEKTTRRVDSTVFAPSHDDHTNFWGYVVDNAGNTKKCVEYVVHRDTEGPYAPYAYGFSFTSGSGYLDSTSCSGSCGSDEKSRGDNTVTYRFHCNSGPCSVSYYVGCGHDRWESPVVPRSVHDRYKDGNRYYCKDEAGHTGNSFYINFEWV